MNAVSENVLHAIEHINMSSTACTLMCHGGQLKEPQSTAVGEFTN